MVHDAVTPWSVEPRDAAGVAGRFRPDSLRAARKGWCLASVPGTRQAELAVLANSVPTTATVNRREATLEVTYDGEPQFKPIDGTSLSYALNAPLPVIRSWRQLLCARQRGMVRFRRRHGTVGGGG